MKILYENDDLIVVEKAAGEPVQSASVRVKDIESSLKNYLREQTPDKVPYLAVIHRLDQPVQGILVFARTPEAAKHLSRQLTSGRMEKWYEARVKKDAASANVEKEGTLVDHLVREPGKNMSKAVSASVKGAKRAELRYRFVSEDTVRIHLLTGRHHQIRVQFAHAGMPLMGDRKYGNDESLRFPALCAWHLAFDDPRTGERRCFEMADWQFV